MVLIEKLKSKKQEVISRPCQKSAKPKKETFSAEAKLKTDGESLEKMLFRGEHQEFAVERKQACLRLLAVASNRR